VFERIHRRVPSRLLLVGDGPDLPLALRLARDAGLADHVHSVGAQEDVLPLLTVSDVFLLPSAQESFGLAALEAMACQVPVIASRVGGLPEVIEHGVTGYLHRPASLDEMAESAVDLLTDEARRRAMGARAAQLVSERFCADRIVPQYEACYRRQVSARN
jgi:N-acetyl-alpha-D-glucosaminyl L-malate synthase BshA